MRKDIAQEFSFTDHIHKLSCCSLEKTFSAHLHEKPCIVDGGLGAYAFLNFM